MRNYLAKIHDDLPNDREFEPHEAGDFPTYGPANRYQNILFIEKEGFMPLFQRVRLAERFDLAIMSTKGMASTAARTLMDELGRRACIGPARLRQGGILHRWHVAA